MRTQGIQRGIVHTDQEFCRLFTIGTLGNINSPFGFFARLQFITKDAERGSDFLFNHFSGDIDRFGKELLVFDEGEHGCNTASVTFFERNVKRFDFIREFNPALFENGVSLYQFVQHRCISGGSSEFYLCRFTHCNFRFRRLQPAVHFHSRTFVVVIIQHKTVFQSNFVAAIIFGGENDFIHAGNQFFHIQHEFIFGFERTAQHGLKFF